MFAERIRTDVSFKIGKFHLKINRKFRNVNDIPLHLFILFWIFSIINLNIKQKSFNPKSRVKQEYNIPLF